MGAKELFDLGNLTAAIDMLIQEVKANPRDLKSRIFLFEVLCFTGGFERAGRQLDAVAQTSDDVKIETGVQMYRRARKPKAFAADFLTAPILRRSFFQNCPLMQCYTWLLWASCGKTKSMQWTSCSKKAAQREGAVKGQTDGKPFDDFRDGDDFIGPFLEVFFQSDYYWLPLDQVETIQIHAPRTLRGLLWAPAKIGLRNGSLGDVFVPGSITDPMNIPMT